MNMVETLNLNYFIFCDVKLLFTVLDHKNLCVADIHKILKIYKDKN